MAPDPLAKHSDEELLELACANSDASLARMAASSLLQRYRGKVFQWCFSVLKDPDLAQDITQEVLINAYRNLETFSGRARFSSWLYSIARFRCLSELRKPNIFSDTELDPDPEDPAGSPDTIYEVEMSVPELRLKLAKHLSSQENEAVFLRYVERLPVLEITRILTIPQATGARGVLQSARRKLRAVYRNQGGWDNA